MPIAQQGKSVLLRISGYLVPLVQQIPPLGIFTGLMTLPVISNIGLLFSNFNLQELRGQIQGPWALVGPWVLVGTCVFVVGLLLALYSIVYLGLHKKHGLVTTGPYRYIRHPQYTGFLLLTIGLTGWSYWVLKNTFGVGWLTPRQTVLLWYVELGAYIVLALIEESYMSKVFGNEYATYKSNSSFYIPFGKARRYDILLSILVLNLILFVVLYPSLFPPSYPSPGPSLPA